MSWPWRELDLEHGSGMFGVPVGSSRDCFWSHRSHRGIAIISGVLAMSGVRAPPPLAPRGRKAEGGSVALAVQGYVYRFSLHKRKALFSWSP